MQTDFSNQQISSQDLPQSEAVHWQALLPSYRKVQRISIALVWGGILVSGIGLSWVILEEFKPWIAGLIALVALGSGAINLRLVDAAYRVKGYAVREHDICYREGLIFRKSSTIPYRRLQQVTLNQGPIMKLAHCHSLELFVPGQLGVLNIPGLSLEEAQRIQTFVLSQIRLDETH